MLSADLFDYIFSFLQRDRATLNSCSAAHPFLSSLAERHLFVHIVIFIGHYEGAIPEGFLVPYLFTCLSERPYLANHVRSITIDGRGHPKYSESFEKLSTILSLIQQANRLSFHNIPSFTFPEIFHSALLNCLRTPHMKEFSLRHTNGFPMALLDGFKNLKRLELDSSRCNFTNCANTTPTSFECLSLSEVYNVHGVTSWAERRVNGLITLHAKAERFYFLDLSPIFNACLESLRSLSLGIGNMFRTRYYEDGTITSPSEDFPFNLSSLPCLEVVTIHATISAYRSTGVTSSVSSLPSITQLVTTAGPSLKRVVFNLECRTRTPSSSGLHDVEWKPLIMLCDSFAHLHVDLCIVAESNPLTVEEVVGTLSENEDLSRLVERGSLRAIKPAAQ